MSEPDRNRPVAKDRMMRALTPSLASAAVASWARETANLVRSLARFWDKREK